MSRLISLPVTDPGEPLLLIDDNIAALARGKHLEPLASFDREFVEEANTQTLLSHQAMKTLQDLRDAMGKIDASGDTCVSVQVAGGLSFVWHSQSPPFPCRHPGDDEVPAVRAALQAALEQLDGVSLSIGVVDDADLVPDHAGPPA